MLVVKSSNTFPGYFLIVSGLLLFHVTVNGQEILHSYSIPLADTIQLSSISFDRTLNTYVWNGNFQKEIHGYIWSADIHQHIRSRLIQTNQTSIQDEYQGLISLRALLSEDWNFQLRNTSDVIADNRVIDLGRMAQHQVLAGFEYHPIGNISGKVAGGYELNSQEEERDKGFTYALGFDAHHVKLEEFMLLFNRHGINPSLVAVLLE